MHTVIKGLVSVYDLGINYLKIRFLYFHYLKINFFISTYGAGPPWVHSDGGHFFLVMKFFIVLYYDGFYHMQPAPAILHTPVSNSIMLFLGGKKTLLLLTPLNFSQ